jgi:uncharacterized protein YutE (UPF0331/DUF86 family)
VTDSELVLKKLAFVETCLAELERLAKPELIADDVRERRFIEHTLQLAIQACLDVASHVVSDQRLGEPHTNHELFDLLAAAEWIPHELGTRLRAAAGFRNILVHGYTAVDSAITRDVVDNHLGDLRDFVHAIRSRIGG